MKLNISTNDYKAIFLDIYNLFASEPYNTYKITIFIVRYQIYVI